MEITHEMLRMGEKNSHNRKQLCEDGIKLESRILRERIRFRGKLFFNLELTTGNTTKITEILW